MDRNAFMAALREGAGGEQWWMDGLGQIRCGPRSDRAREPGTPLTVVCRQRTGREYPLGAANLAGEALGMDAATTMDVADASDAMDGCSASLRAELLEAVGLEEAGPEAPAHQDGGGAAAGPTIRVRIDLAPGAPATEEEVRAIAGRIRSACLAAGLHAGRLRSPDEGEFELAVAAGG